MNKIIIVLMTLTLFALSTQSVQAQMAEGSAKLIKKVDVDTDPRTQKIEACTKKLTAFLTVHGPKMAAAAPSFAREAVDNNLDCTLVAAISGIESGFGRHMAVPYNAWGWCGGYKCGFDSWDHAISTISKSLGDKYCKKWGACEPYAIGKYYAADPNWPHKVSTMMNKINTFKATSKTPELVI